MGFIMGPIAASLPGGLEGVSDSEASQIKMLGIASVQVNFAGAEPGEASSFTDADAKAVQATNFCSLWPAAKPALQALLGVVSNPLVKVAITTVIAAGDAYCSHG